VCWRVGVGTKLVYSMGVVLCDSGCSEAGWQRTREARLLFCEQHGLGLDCQGEQTQAPAGCWFCFKRGMCACTGDVFVVPSVDCLQVVDVFAVD
jgi:hypothetical protein